jgi:hypothetical protein
MCLHCPYCGVREACRASEKAIAAREMMDFEWAVVLEDYCTENTWDHIACSKCHAR